MLFIITPFFIYYVAEQLGVSVIIAIVCAGLMQNSESASSRFVHPRQIQAGLILINLMSEVLSNAVFVILGIMIVRILQVDLLSGHPSWSWLWWGIVLYLVNLTLRLLYGLLTRMGWHGAVIYALGGVRGAITLALAFTITDSVSNGDFRQLVLTETLVIVLSILVPTIIFPFILPHDISERETKRRILTIRQKMVARGLAAVEKIYLPDDVRANVVYDLRDQQSSNKLRTFWKHWLQTSRQPVMPAEKRELEQRALRWAFRAEREYLDMISQKEEMRDYVYQLYNDVLLAESILMTSQHDSW